MKHEAMIPADPKAIVARNTTFVAPANASCSAIPRAAKIFGDAWYGSECVGFSRCNGREECYKDDRGRLASRTVTGIFSALRGVSLLLRIEE